MCARALMAIRTRGTRGSEKKYENGGPSRTGVGAGCKGTGRADRCGCDRLPGRAHPGRALRRGGTVARGADEPVEDRLDLERLEVGLERQDAGGDAGQVRGGPARGRLPGERAEVPAAVG